MQKLTAHASENVIIIAIYPVLGDERRASVAVSLNSLELSTDAIKLLENRMNNAFRVLCNMVEITAEKKA